MEDDNIRDPDSVINEQLLDGDNRSDYDRQIEEAIYLSLNDTYTEQERNQNYEIQLLKNYENIKMERTNIFKPLISDLTRLSKFDKEMKEIYDIIDPIIDAYCGQFIETYEIDKITFERIFGVLGTIRNSNTYIDELKKIIKYT